MASESQDTPVKKIVQWHLLVESEADLETRLRPDRDTPPPAEHLLVAGEHGVRCSICQELHILEKCKRCGGQRHSLALSAYKQIGVFCNDCNRGFTNVVCSCGNSIPISDRTLMKKIEVEPVNPLLLLKWLSAAIVILLVVYLLLR